MSYDALTLSAVTIIVVFIIAVIMVGKSKAAVDIKMRTLARNLQMLQSSEEAMEICREIHKKYPELCAGIDFTFKDEGNGIEIDEWNSDKPHPEA
ncbi:MAG: hypothetical protein GQ573_02325 [Gammaproteobacteria bacterium]|nr:hypothetical protein [Gammaproteobacteria bacterium]